MSKTCGTNSLKRSILDIFFWIDIFLLINLQIILWIFYTSTDSIILYIISVYSFLSSFQHFYFIFINTLNYLLYYSTINKNKYK